MALELTFNLGSSVPAGPVPVLARAFDQRHSTIAAASPAPPAPAKRHCWECLRRRLVCDAGQPYCRKCHDAGVVCPGYDDKKPLKWIANGKISSRPRQHNKRATSSPNGPAITPAPRSKATNRAPDGRSSKLAAKKNTKQSRQQSTVVTVTSIDQRERPLEHSGCLAILPYINMRSATCDVVQAAYYYNTWVLPGYNSTLELAPNPNISKFPMEILPYLSGGLRHTVVALAIGHRIHQLPQEAGRGATVDLWSRLFHHRCLAIREMSDDIASEDKRASNSTIVTILLFLFVELQQMPATNWRQHLDGLTQLIELRGGARKFLTTLPSLQVGISSFFIVGVMANTTCPPLCDNSIISHYELRDLLISMYGNGGYPTCLCPLPLFSILIEINYLRARKALANIMGPASRSSVSPASSSSSSYPNLRQGAGVTTTFSSPSAEHADSDRACADVEVDEEFFTHQISMPGTTTHYPVQNPSSSSPPSSNPNSHAGEHDDDNDDTVALDLQVSTLLTTLLAYSPEASAAQHTDFPHERLVLGRLWQSAIVIYLIASMQSLGVFLGSSSSPSSSLSLSCQGKVGGGRRQLDDDDIRAAHRERLFEQLQCAVTSERLKKSILWPLVVCGFDTAATADAPAAAAAAERRSFVERRLPILGQDVGTSLPEYARMVLRGFWESGMKDWDACFDRAYAFIT